MLFVSGNNDDAKTEVKSILEKVGFATIDLGTLTVGARLQQFSGGPLPTLNLIKLDLPMLRFIHGGFSRSLIVWSGR